MSGRVYQVAEGQPPVIPPRLPSQAVEASRFISWFWDSFTTSRWDRAERPTKGPHWLYLVLTGAAPQPDLDQALLAISVTRYGMTCQDPGIINLGRQFYVQSLGLLQQTLYDGKRSLHDETLATIGVMLLYEVSTCGKPRK